MSERVVGVRIELQDIEPKIWRRIEMPINVSLTTLHDIIQTAFDWDGSHLSGFKIENEFYTVPQFYDYSEDDDYCTDDFCLEDFISCGIKRFSYIYDFGDYWVHMIILGKVRVIDNAVDYPKLLGGARCAPIEDTGGIFTYYEFLEAQSDSDCEPNDDYDDGDPVSWLKAVEFDPEKFDEADLSSKLKKIGLP